MSATLLAAFLATAAVFTGSGLIHSTNRTHGPGSWSEDRARIMLAGALYLLAVVGYGIAIANILAQ